MDYRPTDNFSMSYVSRKVIFPGDSLHFNYSVDAGGVTISLSESDIYTVIRWRLYAAVKAYWFNWLHFQINIDESGSAAGSPQGVLDLDCGFTEPSLI
jgi:hypothetical protein